jgi:hypothetical protein
VCATHAACATPRLALNGTDVEFDAANVHVQSGSGSTSAMPTNGLGNLIVGYNEGAHAGGSHNLVVGEEHTYTSWGGLVAGFFNSITAPHRVDLRGVRQRGDRGKRFRHRWK